MLQMFRRLQKEWQFHLMLVPGILLVFVFSYIPLYGLIIAFEKYNPGLGFASPWVGLQNFEFVFTQPNFLRTITNTIYMSIFKLLGGVAVSVMFALLLNEINRHQIKRTFQTLVYIPYFLSWVILAGVLSDILSLDGVLNGLLHWLGMGPIDFLANPKMFPWTMILSEIWKSFGFGTVIYLAALTGIDPGLYEAAVVDGASRWKQTMHITIPLLVPTIILVIVLSIGQILNIGFDQIYNLYAPIVYQTGDIIDTYVFRLGIQQAQYSVATAVGLFKSVVSCLFVSLSFYLADRLAGYRIF
jgi:putative aldouronate transport system permease protein